MATTRMDMLSKSLGHLRALIDTMQAELSDLTQQTPQAALQEALPEPLDGPIEAEDQDEPHETPTPYQRQLRRPGRKANMKDPRLPPVGTLIVRRYENVNHTVRVDSDGFWWHDKKWPSLSAIAKEITGTQFNGYRFFGLD